MKQRAAIKNRLQIFVKSAENNLVLTLIVCETGAGRVKCVEVITNKVDFKQFRFQPVCIDTEYK